MSTTQTVTLTQLAEHNTKGDLWIAVHGKVYQLASFAADHPGGIDVLLECGGTDGSETYDYAGHSEAAKVTLERFLVGSLEGHDASHSNKESTPKDMQGASKPPTSTISSSGGFKVKPISETLIWAIGLACAGALAAQFMPTMFQGGPGVIISTESKTAVSSALASFWGGILVASLIAGTGFAYLYAQFSKTLEHTNEPFSYPAIIPRPVYVK